MPRRRRLFRAKALGRGKKPAPSRNSQRSFERRYLSSSRRCPSPRRRACAFAVCSLPRCYACKFKGENHLSDLKIGDFWGLTPDNKREWNEKGASIAFVRTERSELLLDGIKDIACVFETDADFAMSHNPLLNEQNTFLINFERKGLHYAVKKTRILKECARRIAGIAAITLLPEKAYEDLKRVYSGLRAKS